MTKNEQKKRDQRIVLTVVGVVVVYKLRKDVRDLQRAVVSLNTFVGQMATQVENNRAVAEAALAGTLKAASHA